MGIVLIANIGGRDIGKKKNGSPLFNNKNVYEESKKLNEGKNFEDLELILLDPVISKISTHFEIKKVFLISTEQVPQNEQDTKYCGEIAKKMLNNKYSFGDVVQLININENPADYDKMFEWYREFIKKIECDKNDEDPFVFISLSGGTQQENMALLFAAVLKFRDYTKAIYTSKTEKEAKEINIGLKLYDELLEERQNALEEAHLYSAAAKLAESRGEYLSSIDILKAKAKRDLFDFEGELEILKRVKNHSKISVEEREEIRKRINEIHKLGKKDLKSLIMELYENMKVRWKQDAYADFLGRLFRFEEAVYYYLISQKFEVDVSVKNNSEKFIEKIEYAQY